MRAIRFHGNQDLRLDQIPVAKVGPDQVKIAPEWCGLCGSGIPRSTIRFNFETCMNTSRVLITRLRDHIRLQRRIFRGRLVMNLLVRHHFAGGN
jgi:hypothetical protein